MTANGIFDEPPGATPLDPDDAAGLIPTWIATRGDLNTAESDNVSQAVTWAFVRHGPWTFDELLTEPMIRSIHRRMFDEVWKWAGKYRTREVNIGAPWHEIPDRIHALLGDVHYQASNLDDPPWTPDELAVRFHHRLVSIHPFPNGNGRHARMAADILVTTLGRPVFTWGGTNLGDSYNAREEYLAALRTADGNDDLAPLVEFSRS